MKRRGFIKALFAGGAGAVAVAVTPMAEAERVVEEATAATGPPSKLATDALAMAAMEPHFYRPPKRYCIPLDINDPELGISRFPVFIDHDGWYMAEASPHAIKVGIRRKPCWWSATPSWGFKDHYKGGVKAKTEDGFVCVKGKRGRDVELRRDVYEGIKTKAQLRARCNRPDDAINVPNIYFPHPDSQTYVELVKELGLK